MKLINNLIDFHETFEESQWIKSGTAGDRIYDRSGAYFNKIT